MRSIRQLWIRFREWRHGPKGFILTIVLLVLAVGAYSLNTYQQKMRQPITYAESLDEVAAVVNGQELTLRDLAYYVALKEIEGQRRGEVMDPEHPRSYWNLYVEHGLIVKESTRNEAMQMAVHDEIFYQMAVEEGLTVEEEDQIYLDTGVEDLWFDLSEYGGEDRLGVTREDLYRTVEKIILAQKYQEIYARLEGAEYEDYDYEKEAYTALLAKNSCEVRDKLWRRVDFGNVVVEN